MTDQKKKNEIKTKLRIILHQMPPEVQGKDPGSGPQCGLEHVCLQEGRDHVCLQEGRDFRLGVIDPVPKWLKIETIKVLGVV